MMKYLLFLLMLTGFCGAACAEPVAAARIKPFYAAARLGYGYTSYEPKDVGTGTGAVALGLQKGDIRMELEASYMAEAEIGVDTNYEQSTVLFSMYYDFPTGCVRPFVGAGVGAAYSEISHEKMKDGRKRKDRWHDTNLAVAVAGGVSFPLSKKLTAEVLARYIYVDLDQDAYNLHALGGIRLAF